MNVHVKVSDLKTLDNESILGGGNIDLSSKIKETTITYTESLVPPENPKSGDILIRKSERDFDVGWGTVPEVKPTLGENISTMLVDGNLYITNTGLPGYGEPIKTKYSNGVLYITTTGIDP